MSISQPTCSLRRLALIIVAIWVLILFYLSGSLFRISARETRSELSDKLIEQYGRAVDDLRLLRKRNEELLELLKEKDEFKTVAPIKKETTEISYEHEFAELQVARRELDRSIRELYFYLNNQLSRTNASYLNHTMNQMLFVMGQSAAFANVDGADAWRSSALSNVTAKIQGRIQKLQEPEDCLATKKLLCNLNKACGFGCQLHHVTYCFIVAYGTNRTLLLIRDGRDWSYSRKGWTSAFLPVSTCLYQTAIKDEEKHANWNGLKDSSSHKIVVLPIIDGLPNRPDFLPLAFPQEFAEELIKLHSNPPVFFIAQFMRYLMRLNGNMQKRVEEAAAKISFANGPVVGLQIRRTDKVGTEAAFHSLSEYMKWAEDWFQVEEHRLIKSLKRRVFIASDDPKVFSEARKSYSDYEIYGDEAVAKSAQLNSRYSEDSLTGVIIDIELLSRCSYLVCTFSSQVCRIGYELMQIRSGDAGESFHSLDDIYYYGGQQDHEQVAIENYKAETDQEIDLKIGDIVGVAGNHWDGFSKGVNRRTGKAGLYPSYLTREKWIIKGFP